MRKKTWLLTGLALLFWLANFTLFADKLVQVAHAATPPAIVTYQGKLLVNSLSATTTQSMIFVIYTDLTAGSAVYSAGGTPSSPTAISVTPSNGLFNVNLGDTSVTNALDPSLFQNNASLYLEVRIVGNSGTETLSPRKQITATPYAFNSLYLNGVAATSTASSSLYIPVSDTSGNFSFNNVTSSRLLASNLATLSGGFISTASSTVSAALHVSGDVSVGRDTTGLGNLEVMASSSTAAPLAIYNSQGRIIVEAVSSTVSVISQAPTTAPTTVYNRQALNLGDNANLAGFFNIFSGGSGTTGGLSIWQSPSIIGTQISNGALVLRNSAGNATSSLFANSFRLGISLANQIGIFNVDSSGNVSASGTLQTFGLSTFSNGFISTASSSVSAGLQVAGALNASSTFQANGLSILTGGFISNASSSVGGTLSVTGATTMSSTLSVNNLATFNNAIMATGTTGNTPGSGSGTRLMWVPYKSAFRAGRVTGLQWDDTNIGADSVAFGADATSSGQYAFAAGSSVTASALGAMAMGSVVTASGITAIALGNGVTATGTAAIVLGYNSTASNDYAVALGYSNTASGIYSTALGAGGLTVKGNDSTVISLDHINVQTVTAANVLVINGGNVGIGNLAPTRTLDLTGTLAVSSLARFDGGFISASSSVTSSLNVSGLLGVGVNPTGAAQLHVQATSTTAVPLLLQGSSGNTVFRAASSTLTYLSNATTLATANGGMVVSIGSNTTGELLSGDIILRGGTQASGLIIERNTDGQIGAQLDLGGKLFLATGTATTTLTANALTFGQSNNNNAGVVNFDSSGNVSASGTFRTFGLATFSNGFISSASSSVSDGLQVAGALNASGTLQVAGNTSVQNITINGTCTGCGGTFNGYLTRPLFVTDGTTTSSLYANQFNVATSTSNQLGLFAVDSSGNTSVSGTLLVFGAATFNATSTFATTTMTSTTITTANLATVNIISGNISVNGNSAGGRVIMEGLFASGPALPNTFPAGSRLVWSPDDAAFRAGYVDGTQWNINAGNIGQYSAAFGSNNIGSGAYSLLAGRTNTASGDSTVALGANSTASGNQAFAAGSTVTASGAAAAGFGTTVTASGNSAFAAGSTVTASGAQSVAFGSSVIVTGAQAMGFGKSTNANGAFSFVGGNGSTAGSQYSFAFGNTAQAMATNSIAIGRNAFAHVSATSSFALGEYAVTYGPNSVALGFNVTSTATSSFAIGQYIAVSGTSSIGFGLDTTARTITTSSVLAIMGGNVGIGQLTPYVSLDITGNLNVTASSSFAGSLNVTGNLNTSSSVYVGSSSTLFFGDAVNGGFTVSTTGATTTFMSYAPNAPGTAAFAFSTLNPIASTTAGTALDRALFVVQNANVNKFAISGGGNVYATAGFNANSTQYGIADVAEYVNLVPGEAAEPGDVLVIDTSGLNQYRKSSHSYAKEVAGVISDTGAFFMGASGPGRAPLALAGFARIKVTDENGPITVGDYLVTASKPGYAMRYDPATAPPAGTVGMAVEPLASGEGRIKVLLSRGLLTGNSTAPGSPTLNTSQAANGQLTLTGDLDLAGYKLVGVKAIVGINQRWTIDEFGNLITKVPTSSGVKDLYALQTLSSEMVLSGSGTLASGEARVPFDQGTTEIIDATVPIKVSITLTSGEAKGVYVSDKNAHGFTVKELQGGTSKATFDWVVVARRKNEATANPTPDPVTVSSTPIASVTPDPATAATTDPVTTSSSTPVASNPSAPVMDAVASSTQPVAPEPITEPVQTSSSTP